MMTLIVTGKYRKDVRLAYKRGKNIDKLQRVVDVLQRGDALSPKYKVHRLSGDWAGYWECHVEPDWLLIWRYEADCLILERTGTHSDLFQ